MSRQRRTKIPNPELVVHYLEREADSGIRIRLTLLNLISKLDRHFALADICDFLKVPLSTAYVWIRSWKKFGYQGIANPCRTTERPPGRPPTLNDADMGQLKVLLSGKDHWTTEEVRELIANTWGVTLSASQVQRILKRKLGMHLSKPYPHDYRRPNDAEEQLASVLAETYNTLIRKGLSMDKIALGFLDGASPQTTSNTVRLWHFGHPGIVKNTTRYKANAIGFYAIQGQSVSDFLPDSTQESVQAFLAKVRAANRDSQAVIVILDRFASHRAYAVKDAAEAQNIVLVYLPPYSPDLNPIEFIWKTVKRLISSRFIHSLEDMRQTIADAWADSVKRCTFARNWIEVFAPSIFDYKPLCS